MSQICVISEIFVILGFTINTEIMLEPYYTGCLLLLVLDLNEGTRRISLSLSFNKDLENDLLNETYGRFETPRLTCREILVRQNEYWCMGSPSILITTFLHYSVFTIVKFNF